MKSKQTSGRQRATGQQGFSAQAVAGTLAPGPQLAAGDFFALAFGLVLGLALIKFGNPVILEARIPPPKSFSEFWSYAWPPSWSLWLLIPLTTFGAGLAVRIKRRWPASHWLWVLPAVWFAWQLVSATRSVDAGLTATTIWHFAGCLACYFLGALVLGNRRAFHWLLIGVLAGFTICLVRAVLQKHFEFPGEQQLLLEGERNSWKSFTPEVLIEMKNDGVIIHTNGVDVANPVILAKYAKGRVMGTLVYANALAGAVLLLWPLSIALAIKSTRRFRTLTRGMAILMTLFLGGAGLFWSGSKFGWLVAMVIVGVWLARFDWPARWKWAGFILVAMLGLTVFTIRFHSYFAAGATSVGARFDYWRAAVQIIREQPFAGSGPGTFQRPYSRLKAPGAEMTRLVHNDYLEQFSDSGIVGGISYAVWIALALVVAGRRLWRSDELLPFAVFLGLLGWFTQGLCEFSLYIPALAWTAFTLLGWLLAESANQIDKGMVDRYI